MSVKINKNLVDKQKTLYSNNVKTYTGFYSDSWNTSITTLTSVSWNCLTINDDGLILAVSSSNNLGYSLDGGNSWILYTVGLTNTWKSVTYSEKLSRFVAVGSGTNNYIMYSNKKNPTSSSDWVLISNSSIPTLQLSWEDVTYQGDLFIAVSSNGNNGSFQRIMLSKDGITWRLDTPPLNLVISNNTWKTITFGNGVFVSGANNSTLGYSRLMYSINDGNTWGECFDDTVNNSLIKSDSTWVDSVYSSKLNLFLMIANSGTYRLIYSNDGKTWSKEGVSTFVNNYPLTCISWSPELNLFIAISSNQYFITSVNGKDWTLRNFPINKSFSSIIWNKKHGNFVSVSNATAAANNITNTKPLGINTNLTPEFYYNTTELNSFYYLNNNEESKILYKSVDFGINPNVNINIHNTYSINNDFPTGIYLNPTTGVIYGNYSGNESKIERKITAYNQYTKTSILSTIILDFKTGVTDVTDFKYNFNGNEGTNFIVNLSNNNVSFTPIVTSIPPYVFTLTSDSPQLSSGLYLNPNSGEISGTVNLNNVTSNFSPKISVYNYYDKFKTITINITLAYTLNIQTTSNSIRREIFYNNRNVIWIPKVPPLIIGPLVIGWIPVETVGRMLDIFTFKFFGFIKNGISVQLYNNGENINISAGSINSSFIRSKEILAIYYLKTSNVNNTSTLPVGVSKIEGVSYPEIGETLNIIINATVTTSFFSTIKIGNNSYALNTFSYTNTGGNTIFTLSTSNPFSDINQNIDVIITL